MRGQAFVLLCSAMIVITPAAQVKPARPGLISVVTPPSRHLKLGPPATTRRLGRRERQRSKRSRNSLRGNSFNTTGPSRAKPRWEKKSNDRDWGFTAVGLSFLEDPEVGLPTWAEFEEIAYMWERGESFRFTSRQQILWDMFTDPFSQAPSDLSLRVPEPPSDLSTAAICRSQPNVSSSGFPLYPYRPILGCGDFQNCTDCKARYMGDPWPMDPPPPPKNASDLLDKFAAGCEQLTEYFESLRRKGEEGLEELEKGFEFPGYNERDNETMMDEREARQVVMQRLYASASVTDELLKEALAVLGTHSDPFSLSRQGLVNEVTRLRRRLARPFHGLAEGMVMEAEVRRIQPYGAVVTLMATGHKALLHLSNVSPQGFASFNASAIIVTDASGSLLAKLEYGTPLIVTISKLRIFARYAVEVTCKGGTSGPQFGSIEAAGGEDRVSDKAVTAVQAFSSWQPVLMQHWRDRARAAEASGPAASAAARQPTLDSSSGAHPRAQGRPAGGAPAASRSKLKQRHRHRTKAQAEPAGAAEDEGTPSAATLAVSSEAKLPLRKEAVTGEEE